MRWLEITIRNDLAIGPGTIKQAHTCDEFIEIRDLDRGADFFRSFLNSFA